MSDPVQNVVSARNEIVQRYADLLDGSSTTLVAEIVRLVARLCGTPWAALSLVDDSNQTFKVLAGLPLPNMPRELSFCGTAVLQDHLFVVPNAFLDDRFRTSPLVSSVPGIRFYAGISLVTPEQCRIGSLCILDTSPRGIGDEQAEALRVLARAVMAELERLRLSAEVETLARSIEDGRESERTSQAVDRRSHMGEDESREIAAALAERGGTIEGAQGAAKALKLHPGTLRSKMRKLGLKRPRKRP